MIQLEVKLFMQCSLNNENKIIGRISIISVSMQYYRSSSVSHNWPLATIF